MRAVLYCAQQPNGSSQGYRKGTLLRTQKVYKALLSVVSKPKGRNLITGRATAGSSALVSRTSRRVPSGAARPMRVAGGTAPLALHACFHTARSPPPPRRAGSPAGEVTAAGMRSHASVHRLLGSCCRRSRRACSGAGQARSQTGPAAGRISTG